SRSQKRCAACSRHSGHFRRSDSEKIGSISQETKRKRARREIGKVKTEILAATWVRRSWHRHPADPSGLEVRATTAAVELLSKGELVALPTETVYGLAADALNPFAVAKIFEAKERPRFNPLIVHLPDEQWLERVAMVDNRSRDQIKKLV